MTPSWSVLPCPPGLATGNLCLPLLGHQLLQLVLGLTEPLLCLFLLVSASLGRTEALEECLDPLILFLQHLSDLFYRQLLPFLLLLHLLLHGGTWVRDIVHDLGTGLVAPQYLEPLASLWVDIACR